MANLDAQTVAGFGDEWRRFPQTGVSQSEKQAAFREYFHIFPWELLPADGGSGVDVGCGSGRWSQFVAPKVRELHVLDASAEALEVARRNLKSFDNVKFYHASLDEMPFADGSLDFAFSLGVLMCVPDTAGAIAAVAKKLKRGAPFLVYIYYAFDNRPSWYWWLWKPTDLVRHGVSRLPYPLRYAASRLAAATVYFPIARTATVLERLGITPQNWPLSFYKHRSFYIMSNDALDRFGTRLEKRFTRSQIEQMLEAAGFEQVRFSDSQPYWCAVGIKR